jgi:hypothetical protein
MAHSVRQQGQSFSLDKIVMPVTYIVGIDVSIRERHGQVVLVHDLSADPAYDRGIEVMA